VETTAPLRFPISLLNRAAQHAYRWFPSYREMPDRIRRLEADAHRP
jgi:hypothetical protein